MIVAAVTLHKAITNVICKITYKPFSVFHYLV
nr:MAG TPA: hypothetical protein [Caudoviricetes sp.]